MVDNRGIEPRPRCLQDSAAHLCVAHRASGATRTRYLRGTDPVHHLWCCAGVEPAVRLELTASGGYKPGAPARSASPALVPSARVERARDRLLKTAPLPLGHEGGTLGAQDSNLNELGQSQPCCRLHQLPSWPAGGGVPPTGSALGERGPRRGRRLVPQGHAHLGGGAVAHSAVADAAGGCRVGPGVRPAAALMTSTVSTRSSFPLS